MNLRLFIPRNLIFRKCPKCKSETTLERAKTNSRLEKILLSMIRFKKYHCKSCKWYGNLFIYAFTKNYKKVLINYFILIFIVVSVSYLLSLFVKKVLIP